MRKIMSQRDIMYMAYNPKDKPTKKQKESQIYHLSGDSGALGSPQNSNFDP